MINGTRVDVAVKLLMGGLTQQSLRYMLIESHLLLAKSHAHILPFVGHTKVKQNVAQTDGTTVVEENYAILTEYMPHGSIREYLRAHPFMLTQQAKLALIQQCVLAVQHLHEGDHHVVHCDIKPTNILIDASLHARVGDFGLSQYLDLTADGMKASAASNEAQGRQAGTYTYMAPELLQVSLLGEAEVRTSRATGSNSRASDIYALAILLWEVLTELIAYDTYVQIHVRAGGVNALEEFKASILDGARPPIEDVHPRYWKILKRGWSNQPETRGTCQNFLDDLQVAHALVVQLTPDEVANELHEAKTKG
jgi:serine/threonine protein kinase